MHLRPISYRSSHMDYMIYILYQLSGHVMIDCICGPTFDFLNSIPHIIS